MLCVPESSPTSESLVKLLETFPTKDTPEEMGVNDPASRLVMEAVNKVADVYSSHP